MRQDIQCMVDVHAHGYVVQIVAFEGTS
ncbi:hypothetical protein RSAG8_11214, partial [Rhizoctonia solani AG-8 WAC10335]